MDIYISKSGEREGPYDKDEIEARIKKGKIAPDNLAWREEEEGWIPLAQIMEPPKPVKAPKADRVELPSNEEVLRRVVGLIGGVLGLGIAGVVMSDVLKPGSKIEKSVTATADVAYVFYGLGVLLAFWLGRNMQKEQLENPTQEPKNLLKDWTTWVLFMPFIVFLVGALPHVFSGIPMVASTGFGLAWGIAYLVGIGNAWKFKH